MFKTIYQIYKALTAISIQILAKDGVEQKKMLDLFGTEENVGPLLFMLDTNVDELEIVVYWYLEKVFMTILITT